MRNENGNGDATTPVVAPAAAAAAPPPPTTTTTAAPPPQKFAAAEQAEQVGVVGDYVSGFSPLLFFPSPCPQNPMRRLLTFLGVRRTKGTFSTWRMWRCGWIPLGTSVLIRGLIIIGFSAGVGVGVTASRDRLGLLILFLFFGFGRWRWRYDYG